MYHVGVSNIFELLDDENDEEGRKKVVSTAAAKHDAAPVKGKAAAPTGKEQPRKAEPSAPAKASLAPKERTERRPRPEGERSQGPRRPKEPRVEGSGAPIGGERNEKGERPPRIHEGGRGRRDNKEKTEFQGPRAKRVYDRKSGTGRGKEVKKGGGGRANWGKEGGEGQWEETTEKQEGEESKPAEQVEAKQEAAPVKEESEEEKKRREEDEKKRKEDEEKEAKMMTLEDYLKKKETERAEKGVIFPDLPPPRQAGEGVDKKELQKWASFTPLKREGEEEDKTASGDSKKDKKKEPKKQAVPVDSILRVQAPKKPRAGKPERTEGSGSPDRRREFKDSPRGGKRRGGGTAPNVKDDSSFPALNTKA